MADPKSLFKPPAGERIDPTSIDAKGATLGHVLTAVSDGSGGQRAGYAAQSGGAPESAQYVTLAMNATLTNERVLTAGTGISITDGGAGGAVTIAATGGGGGSGDFTLLERHTASNSASLDFTSFISASYDKYLIVAESIVPATSTADLQIQIGTGGGPLYDTTAGNYGCEAVGIDSTGAAFSDTSSIWRPFKSMSNSTSLVGNFQLLITGLQSTTRRKDIFGNVSYYSSIPRGILAQFAGTWVTTGTAATALRFLMSSGNIASGSIAIYGFANTSGGGGGGSGAETLISEQALTGTTASVDFTSIPATYRDLRVVVRGRGDRSATFDPIRVRFNSDTGANYDQQFAQANGLTTVGELENLAATYLQCGYINAATAPSGFAGTSQITVVDYRGTTFHKDVMWDAGLKLANSSGNLYREIGAGFWRSTAAINAISVFPESGNFIAGTVVSLYGRM